MRGLEALGRPAAGMRAQGPIGTLRRAWKQLPVPEGLRRAATSFLYRASPAAAAAVRAQEAALIAETLPPLPPSAISPGPLVLSGFVRDASGVGRGARLSARAFSAGGLEPIVHDLRDAPAGWAPPYTGGVWFAHCNPPDS